MANNSLPNSTRVCNKCGIEKAIGSFRPRYGRNAHLRELTCGMCRKRAHLAKHPEIKKAEDLARRARDHAMTVEQYVVWRQERKAGQIADSVRAYKGLILDAEGVEMPRLRRPKIRKCPFLTANPKLDYLVHREEKLLKCRQWTKKNPEKVYGKKLKRKMRLAGVLHDLTTDQWHAIKEHFGNKCVYCGKRGKLTQDHVIPISKGGPHTVSNIVPACRSCNSAKGNRRPPRPVQPLLMV